MHTTHPTPVAISRRRWLFAALAGTALAACGGDDDDAAQGTPAVDDPELVQAARQAVQQGLVGLTLGLLTPDTGPGGPVRIRQGSAGMRRQGGGAALTRDDALYIGSTAKAMTAMLLAGLVEDGVLRWDLTLGQVLPELVSRSDYRPITLRQLLNHRGGVLALTGQDGEEERFFEAMQADPDALPITLAGRRRYLARWLLSQEPPAGVTPGDSFFYSNGGYMIAALMAEAATGEAFESLMQSRVAAPLGLALEFVLPSALGSQDVTGHSGLPGALLPEERLPADLEVWYATIAAAGQNLRCSGDSYARWLRMLVQALRGASTPLPAGAIAELRSLQPGDYALGWSGVGQAGKVALWHNGSDNGCMSECMVEQTGQWAAFGLTNTGYTDVASGQSWVLDQLDSTLAQILTPVVGG